MIGIYKITNLINGKIYIGQSVDINKRWRQHKRNSQIKGREYDKLKNVRVNYLTKKKFIIFNIIKLTMKLLGIMKLLVIISRNMVFKEKIILNIN